MRTYGQHCPLAKALDLVGDRWTLLIVRELLLQGPSRFTDLRNGLPDIATNLLSTRLTELEDAGLLRREAAPPPVATTLYHLTETGRGLEPTLQALGLWGMQFMTSAAPEEKFVAHWLALPLRWFLRDNDPDAPEATIQLAINDEPLVVSVAGGVISTRTGIESDPDVVVRGGPDVVLGLLAGVIPVARARTSGLEIEGDLDALTRVIPTTVHPDLAALAPH